LRFHEAIAHASGNALLISFVAHIHRLVRRFGTTTFAYPGRAQVACEVHAHLLQALANHDAPLAQQIASDDMTAARQIRISMLTEEMDSVDRTE
jgi:DNA-binding FadR family transcriptional regulator